MIYGKEDFSEFAGDEAEDLPGGWQDRPREDEDGEEPEVKKDEEVKLALTTLLSEREYRGVPWDKQEVIRRHVNREEKAWFGEPAPELPKFEKPVVKRNVVGWLNFTKDVLISKVKQLRP